jgi:hypothetical protein
MYTHICTNKISSFESVRPPILISAPSSFLLFFSLFSHNLQNPIGNSATFHPIPDNMLAKCKLSNTLVPSPKLHYILIISPLIFIVVMSQRHTTKSKEFVCTSLKSIVHPTNSLQLQRCRLPHIPRCHCLVRRRSNLSTQKRQ